MSDPVKSENPKGPTLAKDAKANRRLSFLIDMAQEGKPLHAFWLDPRQETLEVGILETCKRMIAAKQPDSAILSVLRDISATNASALRQILGDPAKVTLPRGAKVEGAKPAAANLEALGL